MPTPTKKRTALLLFTVVLLLAGVLIALAAAQPKRTEGSYENRIADRVDFSLEATDFTLGTEDVGKPVTLSMVFRAKKNEADFYAVLERLGFSGIQPGSVTYACLTEAEPYLPEKLPLPAENGVPREIAWQIDLTFTPQSSADLTFTFDVAYTAGINEYMTDEHLTQIPITVTFE